MQLLSVGFITYFFIVTVIAYMASRYYRVGVSAYSQMIMGNRSVNYILTALSAHASDMSEWLFMSVPALMYMQGLSSLWIPVGLVVGMWFTWQYVAPQLRKKTESLDCYTISTFFDRRFQDSSGVLRITSAGISIFFFTIYIAAGLKAFGMFAESLFNLPYIFGVLTALLLMVVYVLLGGFRALAWIDCFQALFLLLVIILVPLIAWRGISGWESIFNAAQTKGIVLSLAPSSWISLINSMLVAFSWGVGYFGLPHLLTKFMGIAEVKEIVKAKYLGISWQTTVLSAASCIGLLGLVYFPSIKNPELLFTSLVRYLFSDLIAGFMMSAVAGATISVITAQMLVLVSIITEDFYKYLCPKQATEKNLLFVYRMSIGVIACGSLLVSLWYKSASIQNLVSYAWMGFAASFGPLVLLSLHSNYVTKYGAYACLIVGGFTAALWPSIHSSWYGIEVPASAAGFIISIVSAYFVSWLMKKIV